MYNFLNTYATLADSGYFITNKNREEKYLEIINDRNGILIDALEEYLTQKDRMDEVSWMHKKHTEFIKNIDILETEDENEVAEFYNQYISSISNPE